MAADRLSFEHRGTGCVPERFANLQLVKHSTLNSRRPESYIQLGLEALNARMFHAAARPFRLDTL